MENTRFHVQEMLNIIALYQDITGNILHGTVLNISAGGVYIDTKHPLAVGTSLKLRLDSVDLEKIVDVYGHVVRVDHDKGIAVEFTDKDTKDILELIKEIKRIMFSSLNIQQNAENFNIPDRDIYSIAGKGRNNRMEDEDSRRHPRKSLKIEVRFQDTKGKVLKGTVRDLSLSGVYIDTSYPLELKTNVIISFDAVDIGKVVDVYGRVVRVIPNRGMAVDFGNKKQHDIELLLEVMKKLDQRFIR